MATERPYTLETLIRTLAALAVEGAMMVAGTTWLMLQKHDVVMAYVFAAVIALFSVGLGALQIHHYQQDRRLAERQDWIWQYENEE